MNYKSILFYASLAVLFAILLFFVGCSPIFTYQRDGHQTIVNADKEIEAAETIN